MAEAATTSGSPEPVEPEPVPLRARGWAIPVLLTAVVAVAVAVIAAAIVTLTAADPKPQTVMFKVPAGTAESVYFGTAVDIMPPEVALRVGDTLVVRNDDTQTASVGPFTVRPGETLTQTFQRPQTLVGECTLSGTGEVKIVVT